MFPAQIALPADLLAEWRTHAEGLRHYGADAQATAVDQCANRLEEAFRQMEDEQLTLQDAAEESGYTADHLGRLVRDGKIPNAGRPSAPRISRRDVPIKASPNVASLPQTSPSGDTDNAQVVQSIIQRGIE
jgi:hypothetical protein